MKKIIFSLAFAAAILSCSKEQEGIKRRLFTSEDIKCVDLGLSVKWADCNLGTIGPEGYGGYYQWAGLEDVASTSICLDWDNCPYHIESDSNVGWTKYILSGFSSFWSGTGNPDDKTVLDPEDDAVHVALGDNWRMPTDAEWTELRDNCTWEWTEDYNGTGIRGQIVTSNKPGYTDKSIFLPAAGYRYNDFLSYVGSFGCYWSSSLNVDNPLYAYFVYFTSDNVIRRFDGRYSALSIRPVSE